MFPATHPSRPRASGRVISLLLLTAALIGTLPTVRGASSFATQSESAVAATGSREAEKADAEVRASGGSAAIRGPWRAVRMESADQESPAAAVHQLTLVVDEKTFVMRLGQKLIAETPYSVDAGQNPRAIKLTYEGQATHGIWERKGDTLTFCLADADQARPKKFVVGPEGGKLLLVFRIADEGEKIPLFVMDVDGRNLRRLVALAEYTAIGSPSWSPDGKRIAFDAWRTVFGESYGDSHVFVTNADGSAARDIGDGTFPSWSPDGKRLAMGRYGTNRGVWITSADGTRKELLDPAGWGIKFCPTANRVAYTTYGSSGANLCVRDLDKTEGRNLLTRAYRQVYWGLMWSPDGQWIAFKADTADGKPELAAVHVEGEAKGFKVLLPKAMPESDGRFTSHIAWGGNGKRVLVGLCAPTRQWGHKMYFLDFAQKDSPQLVPGPYPDGYLTGICLSPDGKKILFGYSIPPPSPKKPASP